MRKAFRTLGIIYLVILAGFLNAAHGSNPWFVTFANPGFQTPTFVQVGPTCFTLTCAYPGPQVAGNLNYVAIGWNTAVAISTVTDSNGNVYSRTNLSGVSTGNQAVYVAPSIVGGTNTVTVAFVGGGTPAGIDVRILEYSGCAGATPVDTTANNTSTTGTALSSGTATTTQPDLIVGAFYVANAVASPGSGFTTRIISGGGNAVEDLNLAAAGTQAATATQNTSGFWIAQLTALKAAPGGGGGGSSSGGSSSSSSSGGGSSSGGTGLLTFLTATMNSGNILSGQYSNHFASAGPNPYGNGLSAVYLPSSGATPANITINDHSSGDTGKAPSIMGVFLNSNGTCGSALTLSQGLAIANGQLAAGGIVLITFGEPSPTQTANGGCTGFTNGGVSAGQPEFPNVITPGTNAYKTYMYGTSGLGGTGTPCTSAAPCGGVWAQAQALKSLTAGKHVMFRTLAEGNLGGGGAWWSTNGTGTGSGGATSATYLTLYKQTIDYIRALGVNNIVIGYCFNAFSGAFSNNDPGASYRDFICGDLYGYTSQAALIGGLNDPSVGFTYAQSQGVPVLLCEAGASSANNASITAFTYDNSQFDKVLQTGSTIKNLVGTIIWNQNWALNNQNGAATYMNNTIVRSALPPITKLIAPQPSAWKWERAANDPQYEHWRHAA